MENVNNKVIALIPNDSDVSTGDDEVKWLKNNLRRIIKSEDDSADRIKLMAMKITAVRAYLDIIKYQNNIQTLNNEDDVNTDFSLVLDDAEPAAIATEIRRRLQA